MNIQQLEYIVALDTHRQFVTAAEKCHVTQATLSMMIRKLEDELGVRLFDRSRHPVVPTDTGIKLVAQAKRILREVDRLTTIVEEERDQVSGELRLGIIPTLAPYLLPLFLQSFLDAFPDVQLRVVELTTEEIIHQLERHELDAGLLAIPLHRKEIAEQSLFFEEFFVYSARDEKLMHKKYIMAQDIDINRLWLLEEGHCLRAQVINLCELKKREKESHQLDFAAGSIETLKRIVEANQGVTILPELAVKGMTKKQLEHIRQFRKPAPVREVGLVTYRYYVKEKLINALRDTILAHIPDEMMAGKKRQVIDLV